VISIGNDIVALHATDKAKTMDPRFYGKILSAQELLFYQETQHSLDVFIWLVWSIKESVYKCQKRLFPDLGFAPFHISVQQLNYSEVSMDPFFSPGSCAWQVPGYYTYCSGEVTLHGAILYFRSLITDQYIFSVVAPQPDFKDVYCGIRCIDDTSYLHQSSEVRAFALEKLADLIPYANSLAFYKPAEGYPVLQADVALPDSVFSFSHHYNFIAYCFSLSS
jgi:phosphopantetheinyl transferase (holo-ACP synthase)